MPTLRQKLRQVEQAAQRLTGDRRQAAGLRKKIERRLQQLAAGHARATGQQRVSASHEPQVYERLVRSGKAGWVNVPGKGIAVLVERGTGCTLVDSRGGLILRSRRMLPSKPAINKGDFIKYLRRQGIEEYVPHMYLDKYGNVTVGIGHLVPDVDKAKGLSFTKRGTTVGASHSEIELAFNTVKSSGLINATAPAFRNLTNIFMTEADAVSQAMKDIDEFLRILKSSDYFPEFDTYPTLAKRGLLDLAYFGIQCRRRSGEIRLQTNFGGRTATQLERGGCPTKDKPRGGTSSHSARLVRQGCAARTLLHQSHQLSETIDATRSTMMVNPNDVVDGVETSVTWPVLMLIFTTWTAVTNGPGVA